MKSIYLLSSLTNFKDYIKFGSGTDYDHVAERLLASATWEVERYCKRKLRGRTYGANGLSAEYQNGNGKSRLYTNQYPIISVTELYDDPERDFGSDTLKTSTDYYIFSEQGVIQLNADAVLGTVFGGGKANIKLIYTAGYDEFQIIDDTNDRIDFQESDGGSVLTANLEGGIYTSLSLATHIATQMDSAGGDTYTVTYNYQTSKFTIASDGSYLKLLWNTGTNAYRTICQTIGFRDTADSEDNAAAITLTANDSVLGIPEDLEQACLEITERMWQKSKLGAGRFDKESEQLQGGMGGSLKWNKDPMPPHVKSILNKYKRMSIIED